ncbi:hypothetical protein KCP70_25180 [Salmonella enterica subsp. enterica]|nr:hypothetical protein KCP70_25180 [Salmonella enterica subsp. enterica]
MVIASNKDILSTVSMRGNSLRFDIIVTCLSSLRHQKRFHHDAEINLKKRREK